MKSLMVGVSLAASTALCPAALLYDVPFSAPVDTLGLPAAVGGGGPVFHSPSSKVFGTSQVVASGGGLNDRPLLLIPGAAGGFTYSQYGFAIDQFDHSPIYQFDLDISLSNMAAVGDELVLLFDTPTSTRIDFGNGGQIRQKNSQIGTFIQNIPIHITVLLNLPQNSWTITKDGAELFNGLFFQTIPAQPTPPTRIDAFRINLTDSSSPPTGAPLGYIDNIRITSLAPVPEPGVAALAYSGLIGIGMCQRRRGRREA